METQRAKEWLELESHKVFPSTGTTWLIFERTNTQGIRGAIQVTDTELIDFAKSKGMEEAEHDPD
jgi:hypothetical protein